MLQLWHAVNVLGSAPESALLKTLWIHAQYFCGINNSKWVKKLNPSRFNVTADWGQQSIKSIGWRPYAHCYHWCKTERYILIQTQIVRIWWRNLKLPYQGSRQSWPSLYTWWRCQLDSLHSDPDQPCPGMFLVDIAGMSPHPGSIQLGMELANRQ